MSTATATFTAPDGYTYPLAPVQGGNHDEPFLLRDDAGELPEGWVDECAACGGRQDDARQPQDWAWNCQEGPRCAECGPCRHADCHYDG